MAKELPTLSRVCYTSVIRDEKSTGILVCYALTGKRTTAIILPDNSDPSRCYFVGDRVLRTLYGFGAREDDQENYEARHPNAIRLVEPPERIIEELLTSSSTRIRRMAKELMKEGFRRGLYEKTNNCVPTFGFKISSSP